MLFLFIHAQVFSDHILVKVKDPHGCLLLQEQGGCAFKVHFIVPCYLGVELRFCKDAAKPRLSKALRLNNRTCSVGRCAMFAEPLLVLEPFLPLFLFQFVGQSDPLDFQLVKILWLHHPCRERLVLYLL